MKPPCDHKCREMEYYQSNPYAPKWEVKVRWYGFALEFRDDDIRIVYCPWCGEKLDKEAIKPK